MSRWTRPGGALTATVLIAALAWWLVEPSIGPGPDGDDLPDEMADEPDLYMEQARITQFEPDGTIKYRLNASKVRHFDRDLLTRLTDPVMQIHTVDQPPWNVESKHGYIRTRRVDDRVSEVVFLRDSVVLTQRYPDGRFIRVRSPSMYLYPDEQFADTDRGVIIDTDAGRTRAAGFRANLDVGRMHLNSGPDQRVHTIVLPDQMK